MRRTGSLLLSLALLLACASSSEAAGRKWTVLGWFSGDDAHDVGIEEAHLQNMDELARVGSGGGVDFVVQADRGQTVSAWLKDRYTDPEYRGAKRFHIERGNPVAVETLGEVNMGDPKQLLGFLEWARDNYPAERYMLIFNSHGSGTLSWRGPGSTSDGRPGRVELGPRYVAYDDTDDDCLTIFEMAAVLEQFSRVHNGGRKVDLVAFDSCMAETVEALYQMRDGVANLAGSESLMPGEGLNYHAIARALGSQPSISARDLGEVVAKSFITRAEAGNVYAVFSSDGAEALAGATSSLARELHAAGKELGVLTLRGRRKMDNHGIDLASVAHSVLDPTAKLAAVANAEALAQSARKVLAAIESSRTSLRRSGPLATSEIGGLSIQWPAKENWSEFRKFYRATAFAKATLWDEFLDWREGK